MLNVMGQRLHDDGSTLTDIRAGFRKGPAQWLERLGSLGPVLAGGLTAAGLDAGLAMAATETRWDDALRAERARVPTGDRPAGESRLLSSRPGRD